MVRNIFAFLLCGFVLCFFAGCNTKAEGTEVNNVTEVIVSADFNNGYRMTYAPKDKTVWVDTDRGQVVFYIEIGSYITKYIYPIDSCGFRFEAETVQNN